MIMHLWDSARNGFTLIEVVVSLAVLSLAALVIGQTLMSVWQQDASSEKAAQAAFLAQGELEYRRAGRNLSVGDHDCEAVGGTEFDCVVSIRKLQGDLSGLLEVRATVSWKGPRREESVELLTWIRN